MESMLSVDINSDDSATALWAKGFMVQLEPGYRAYKPNLRVIKRLEKYKNRIEVRVIGGNWCSDTRREIPRLCKVLAYMEMPETKLSYYRVNRDKKSVQNDFANQYAFSFVPTIVIYLDGKAAGKIVEVTRLSMEKDMLQILEK